MDNHYTVYTLRLFIGDLRKFVVNFLLFASYTVEANNRVLCFGREDFKSLPVAACQDIAQISDSKSLSGWEAPSILMKYSIHQIAYEFKG